jgi:two-component system, chemotaxis family, CheB/CheR fusion protein
MSTPLSSHSDASVLYLIVLGASAGGLEPVSDFLRHLPELSQVAILIAQQRSPDYASHLVQLLSRETPWEVLEVKEGMPLEAGKVYIAPSHSEVGFHEQWFTLTPSIDAAGARPSVDLLFRRLAMQAGSQAGLQAIAIVLSGTGEDGSRGLAPVRQVGGWTFAQAPETAQHQSMPLAAIQTGLVDFVLEPALMGARIQHLITEFAWTHADPANSDQGGEAYAELLSLLEQRSGSDFSTYKNATIQRRMQTRLMALHLQDVQAYLDWVHLHPEELDALFNSILIGVTGFFRNPEAFAAIESCLKTLLASKTVGDSLRIWVPGCSTGQEPYSFAILIQRLLRDHPFQLPVQIFATDIDERALAHAREGLYTEADLRQVPPDLRASCFTPKEDHFEINKALRSMVIFSQHDLSLHPPFIKLDLISCRNLLIYFGTDLQKHVLPIFHYALNPQGLLMLGLSEDVNASRSLFKAVSSSLKIFRRTKMKPGPLKPFVLSSPEKESAQIASDVPLRESLEHLLCESMTNPFVLVNEALEVLDLHGQIAPYLSLPQGRLSMHLYTLCHRDLHIELRSLILKAQRENIAVSGLPRRWPRDQWLRLRVQPDTRQGTKLMLVIFEQVETLIVAPADAYALESQRILELEQELATRDAMMQTLVDQLDSSNVKTQLLNEELQSTNEELQVSNEELSSSNEELQAINEEIHAAYTELRNANTLLEHKEGVLSRSKANLQALLENTVQAFVLVDNDYCVMTYNPQAAHLHGEIYQRPMTEGMLLFNAFSDSVIQELLPLLRQAHDGQSAQRSLCFEHQGNPYWLRYDLIPVRSSDGHQIGIAISALEETQQQQKRQNLERSNALIDAIFNATDVGLCLVDESGTFAKVNQRLCQIYGYKEADFLGQPISTRVPPEQTTLVMERHAEGMRNGSQPYREWRVQRKDGNFIDIGVTANVLHHPDGSRYKVATVRDITQDKKNVKLLLDTQERTGVGGWEIELPGGKRHWTPQIYALYGWPLDAPIDDESALSAYLPESRARIKEAFRRAKEYGEPYDLELELVRSTGEKIWVRTICKATYQDGQVIRLNGTLQDITERKQTDIRLREHEQLYRSIAENFPNGMVMVLDKQLQCLFSDGQQKSPALLDVDGNFVLEALPAVFAQELQTLLELALRGEQHHLEISLEDHWYQFSMVPLQDSKNGISRVLLVIQNITDSKRAVEEKTRLIQELTLQNKDLNEFAYIISHNLRAPVANLLGLIDLLSLEGHIQPEGVQTLKFLENTANKLDDIIQDLNRILDIRRHNVEACKAVNLQSECEWVMKNLTSQYPEIENWVNYDLQIKEVYTVPSYIQSILSNLISNAVKYRHPARPPLIELSSSQHGEHICLSIRDNGLGLDLPAIQDEMFRLYKRFHPHIEGKGLGLYLIKSHAEALGGKVEISSQVGKGSTFGVYIREKIEAVC